MSITKNQLKYTALIGGAVAVGGAIVAAVTYACCLPYDKDAADDDEPETEECTGEITCPCLKRK